MMRIPLHLGNDYSPEANRKRVELALFMANLNPRGFRTFSRNNPQKTRLEGLSYE